MGQVVSVFQNGFPGAVSRSVDDVIVSLPNLSGLSIPFGAPVFLRAASDSVAPFDAATYTDATRFLGFAVRVPDKTPGSFGSGTAAFEPKDPVDVLVRGTLALPMEGTCNPGMPVYLRISDGKLTANAGSAGSTIQLPDVAVRSRKDGNGVAEVVVKTRHLI
jgi:hypothetical protein